MTIREFIEHSVKAGKKPATIKRYVATIARVYVAAKLLNPCSSEAVRLGLKKSGGRRRRGRIKRIPWGGRKLRNSLRAPGEGLRVDRERAMLCVAYETLARRGELVALEVRDLDFHPDATGLAMIRRGKTDQAGEGSVAYLSRTTMKWLQEWPSACGAKRWSGVQAADRTRRCRGALARGQRRRHSQAGGEVDWDVS
jgi:integrase